MKKSKKKNRPTKTKGQPARAPAQKNRRSFMSMAGTIAGGAVLLGGAGFWGVRTVQASVAERDLSGIGQGTPTIVQVHDTQCQTCIALQRELRAALQEMDEHDLSYRVADIKSEDGLTFAARFGAGHSTLLFFDGEGNLTGRLIGPNDRQTLARAFGRHAAAAL
ncbi:hypothetical protein MWU60_13585 [Yoonia sp. F2084L]|uniref:TlpA family protein disulfide reductase n=1 Tax=Yoonia sp. F2084L TaxID=2926419 RepID=UPI001FF1F5F6|nr:hypothetical protein [Yoonia sp. F2084L]MCK0096607.1 hypothetical protein [Yoonia sp. F2084L]